MDLYKNSNHCSYFLYFIHLNKVATVQVLVIVSMWSKGDAQPLNTSQPSEFYIAVEW